MQIIARVVAMHLETTSGDPPIERFRASTLMTYFADSYLVGSRRHQLWLGENTWPDERLSKLVDDG